MKNRQTFLSLLSPSQISTQLPRKYGKEEKWKILIILAEILDPILYCRYPFSYKLRRPRFFSKGTGGRPYFTVVSFSKPECLSGWPPHSYRNVGASKLGTERRIHVLPCILGGFCSQMSVLNVYLQVPVDACTFLLAIKQKNFPFISIPTIHAHPPVITCEYTHTPGPKFWVRKDPPIKNRPPKVAKKIL